MLEARLLSSLFVALSVALTMSACSSPEEEKSVPAASVTVIPIKDNIIADDISNNDSSHDDSSHDDSSHDDSSHDDISSEVHYESDQTIVDLRSESGIGSVEMSCHPGSQSPELVLRLHLKGLENLRLQDASTIVEASVSSSHPHEIRQSASTENGGFVEINPSDPLWLDITIVNNEAGAQGEIPLEDGYFQVVVPREICSGEPDSEERHRLSVSWIDFYR